MIDKTQIKKYSQVYDLLQDLKEYNLANVIEQKLKTKGYEVKVIRGKYAFKWYKIGRIEYGKSSR